LDTLAHCALFSKECIPLRANVRSKRGLANLQGFPSDVSSCHGRDFQHLVKLTNFHRPSEVGQRPQENMSRESFHAASASLEQKSGSDNALLLHGRAEEETSISEAVI
jgi:hypothetical protein